MKERPPQDFDWVSARAKCSALSVFQMLQAEAERSTDAANQAVQAKGGPPSYAFNVQSSSAFIVIRRMFGGDIGVRFVLTQDEISVTGVSGSPHPVPGIESFTATLTLSDDGECRLLVNGKELDRWQVLKRALEPLLFPPER